MSIEKYTSQSEEMRDAHVRCSDFKRRGDIDMFSMADYESCENCRNMYADGQCVKRGDDPKWEIS